MNAIPATYDLEATGWSLANALFCGAGARRAYEPDPTIANAATDTQVLVEVNPSFSLVAHRGTCDTRGWLRDAQIRMQPLDGSAADVHRGFLNDAKSVSGAIFGATPRNKPVVVTGHSKGAAEAVLTAYDLHRAGYDVRGVYVFGKPRVGNRTWALVYNDLLGASRFASRTPATSSRGFPGAWANTSTRRARRSLIRWALWK